MWRRVSAHLKTLVPRRSGGKIYRSNGGDAFKFREVVALRSSQLSLSPFQGTKSRFFSTSDADNISSMRKKTVEDIMPIATGHEREEIEAELEGKKRFDMDAPVGPFGTKKRKRYLYLLRCKFQDAPAIVQSYYDKRIVGCPGGEGEDEHDVVWFWLEKGKPHECPVCSQYFMLEVLGEGGPPDGHGVDDH